MLHVNTKAAILNRTEFLDKVKLIPRPNSTLPTHHLIDYETGMFKNPRTNGTCAVAKMMCDDSVITDEVPKVTAVAKYILLTCVIIAERTCKPTTPISLPTSSSSPGTACT